jgi:hypothetical protein
VFTSFFDLLTHEKLEHSQRFGNLVFYHETSYVDLNSPKRATPRRVTEATNYRDSEDDNFSDEEGREKAGRKRRPKKIVNPFEFSLENTVSSIEKALKAEQSRGFALVFWFHSTIELWQAFNRENLLPLSRPLMMEMRIR